MTARFCPWPRLTIVVLWAAMQQPADACPFCTALKPTLGQLREQSAVAALAEVESQTAAQTELRLQRAFKGRDLLAGKKNWLAALDLSVKPGDLVLVFGTQGDGPRLDELSWHAVAVNEASYAYFARAPATTATTLERLRYFARFLEQPDRLIAEDAYLEFGHAPLADVARAADLLSMTRIREWLKDPQVPPERKGFYGLALGLCVDADQRRTNAEFLRELIVAPENDFRAGFDGILGGYLLLAGQEGLELVEARYLASPRAADGDVRHTITALRFYHEYGHDIPAPRLAQAMRQLLARPEFAAAAITDLARWEDWDSLERIAALYTKAEVDRSTIRIAIVGYLLACPQTRAATSLARLREVDAAGVAAAQEALSRTSGLPAKE